jgi:hypothetical protein
MATCQQPGANCICIPPPGEDFCAIHRKCPRCHTAHLDKSLYVCSSCGKEMCAGATFSGPDPTDKKQLVKLHKVEKHLKRPDLCGPVLIRKAGAAA